MTDSKKRCRCAGVRLVVWVTVVTGGLLASCLTRSDPIVFDTAPLFGMIYDARNEPVSGALVTVNEKRSYRSGVMGRVVIPDLFRGAHGMRVEKQGYEPIDLEVEFLSRSHVLYVRMISYEYLLSAAESSVARGRFDEARVNLDRAAAISPTDPRTDYVGALLAYRRRDGKSAAGILKGMIDDGHGSAYVHLLLADVQEYLLEDIGSAASSLRRYLQARDDPEAEARLARLAGSTRSLHRESGRRRAADPAGGSDATDGG